MNFEKFKEQIAEDIKEALYEQGIEVRTEERPVEKLNESYEALTITPENSNIGMNINLTSLYKAVEDGRDYSEVSGATIENVKKHIVDMPEVDVDALTDYEQMKSKLTIEVVSKEANAEMLDKIPHQDMEDMAVVYRFVLGASDDGRSTILVTNNLIENMGVTPEQLHADAIANAPELRPAEIKGMSQVMFEMMGADQFEMFGMPVATDIRDEQMIVATVSDKTCGAGVIAYPNFMENVAQEIGCDFYILPSSIHEVLVVPDKGDMTLSQLQDMVREVNATQVAPNEKLTDNVYHYDAKDHIFELGEKFEARMAVKNADRDAKDSVLGDLAAKKEEVAKAPKKEQHDKGDKAKGGEAL